MTRKIVMLIVMAFALGFVGCRSCLAPYDSCQPTLVPERGESCMGELYRCGSILGGAQRTANVSGDCEECGGGQVEYYAANDEGQTEIISEVSYADDANSESAVSTISDLAETSAVPPVKSAASYSSSHQMAPYAENNFSLYEDAEEAY